MNSNEVLVIALRVMAVYLFVNLLVYVPIQLMNMEMMDSLTRPRSIWLSMLLPSAIKLLIAILFWYFPNTTIKFIVPQGANLNISSNSFGGLNTVLISALGVYFVCCGFFDLSYYLALKSELNEQFDSVLQPTDKASLIASTVQIIIGFCLVAGNKGLSKIIRKARQ